MVTPWIAVAWLVTYLVGTSLVTRQIPTSLSHIALLVPYKWRHIFTLFIWGLASMFLGMGYIVPGILLFFTGATPDYKSGLARDVHNVSAGVSMGIAVFIVGSLLAQVWCLIFVGLLALYGGKRRLLWIELLIFTYVIYFSLWEG